MDFNQQIRSMAKAKRLFRAFSADFLETPIYQFYKDQFHDQSREAQLNRSRSANAAALDAVKVVSRDAAGMIVECNGAFVTDPKRHAEDLEVALKSSLPEEFKAIYREFGSVLLITRAIPLMLQSVDWMVAEFCSDPDVDIQEGRFFRFAQYPGESVYYGLRKNEFTDHWEVVGCTYGLLYSEMIGCRGRDSVVANSFGDWLERWIETDGFPDPYYNSWGSNAQYYLTALDK